MKTFQMFSIFLLISAVECIGGENLLKDPSFESVTPDSLRLAKFKYDKVSKKINPTPPGVLISERDSTFARTGKHSMRFEFSDPGASNEMNYQSYLPCEAGKDYELRFHYFIAASDARVAGRITFFDKEKKQIKYLFPEASVKEQNKWTFHSYEFTPPANAEFMQLTLWFMGKGRIYLDDLFLGKVKKEKIQSKQPPLLLSGKQDFLFWKEDAWNKVARKGIPDSFQKSAPVELSLAGNEREPFQLVVSPKRKMKHVALEFGEFENKGIRLPRNVFSYETVGYIELKHTNQDRMRGVHADPLLAVQENSVEARENLTFYVTAEVPASQKPGTYTGKIYLKENGKRIAETDVNLNVRSFSLPEVPFLKTWFLFTLGSPGAYQENDPRGKNEILDDLYIQYRKHRIMGNQGEYLPRPAVTIENNTLTVTDWSKFDQRVSELRDRYGFRVFPVPYLGMMGDYFGWFTKDRQAGNGPFGKYPLLSDTGLKLTGEYARQFTEHVEKKFPELTFFAYLYDEPAEKIRPEVRKLTDSLHRSAPGLKIFIPMEVADNAGYVHTWCVPFGDVYVDLEKQKIKQDAGHDVWYYNWKVQLDDSKYIMNRLFAWQIYANDGTGGLLWHSAFSPKGVNPWKALDRTHENGAATIFYPPHKPGDKISPSMRSMQVSEGIEDFSYLMLLEQKIESKFPGYGKRRVKEILRELMPDLKFSFVSDFSLLNRLRNKIAGEIEDFDLKFPALLLSTPQDNSMTELNEVEFQLFAPAGSVVRIDDDRTEKIPSSGTYSFRLPLRKFGMNPIAVHITFNGVEREFRRSYVRKEDEKLTELKTLQNATPAEEIRQYLHLLDQKKSYTAADQEKVHALLEKYKTLQLSRRIKQSENLPGALSQMFRKRAETMLANKMSSRAVYYMDLSEQIARAGSMDSYQVKAEPVMWGEYTGIKLSNGVIEAVILECGGRLASFRFHGVEMLADGGIRGIPELERAQQRTTPKMVATLRSASGMEDAGGEGLWPVSFVDWNLDFRTLSPDRITCSAETLLPGGIFRFRRSMTMKAGSPDLILDYSITNILPADYISDNPGHYELEWRARFLPAVGNEPSGSRNSDALFVSGSPKLPETALDNGRIRFERPSIQLDRPYVGAYDTALKKGFALLFDPNIITHAYVWFDTWEKQHELYTIELPRSSYLRNSRDPLKNKPFSILPGNTMNFQITMRGLDYVSDSGTFQKAVSR